MEPSSSGLCFCMETLSSHCGAHFLTLEGDSALSVLQFYLLASNHPTLFLLSPSSPSLSLLWVRKVVLLCPQPLALENAIFFRFCFFPGFPWAHSGLSVLTALSKCGADLLILLTLHLYSVCPGISGKMAASLLSCSPAVSLQCCHTKSLPITHFKRKLRFLF